MVTKIETAKDIIAELKTQANTPYKQTMVAHGAQEPVFGVKVEYMKKIQKRIKQDYQLAKDLFATGNYDAMYLAGLIADDKKMTKSELQGWAKNAKSPMIGEYSVPWVAAESNHGWELALQWIDSKQESIAATGWATLSSFVAITEDENLDLGYLKKLLQRVEKSIHDQPNRVRHCMNQFMIACGGYVAPLTEFCIQVARKIGPISVDMHGTACKVPFAPEYIAKVKNRGSIGKKRKSSKC